ncbi:50S ribosomal protein L39e [Candidatus Parvarchaeota archaeon]|nr:50S ribosomal protein L39e [Candidatus Parvarchaeota archaeon]
MGKIKSPEKKARLGHALKQNRRIPIFVIAKTNRRISHNRNRRAWRRQKLRISG